MIFAPPVILLLSIPQNPKLKTHSFTAGKKLHKMPVSCSSITDSFDQTWLWVMVPLMDGLLKQLNYVFEHWYMDVTFWIPRLNLIHPDDILFWMPQSWSENRMEETENKCICFRGTHGAHLCHEVTNNHWKCDVQTLFKRFLFLQDPEQVIAANCMCHGINV